MRILSAPNQTHRQAPVFAGQAYGEPLKIDMDPPLNPDTA